MNYCRSPDLRRHTGKRESALREDVINGLLPRPVKLGARAVGWPEHEIAAVMTLRAGGGTDDQIRGLVRHLHAERERAAQRVLDSMLEAA